MYVTSLLITEFICGITRFTSINIDKITLVTLKKKIEQVKYIASKAWLLKKIEELRKRLNKPSNLINQHLLNHSISITN